MPNWKFPCIKCAKPVKSNQKGIECGICFKWVHFKCTNLTKDEYDSLETNANMPFYCLNCKPGIPFTDVIAENSNFPPTSLPQIDINTTPKSSSPSFSSDVIFENSNLDAILNDSISSFDFFFS